jgi:hypothetical protein
VRRPVRPADKRRTYPAVTERVYKPLVGERLDRHAALVKRYNGIAPTRR